MSPSFTCVDNTICMPYAWVNDGICNCADCSDEWTTSKIDLTLLVKYICNYV